MKKRIALEDKNEWDFESSEPVIYYNDRKVYPEVKSLTFLNLEEKDCGPEFDLSEIALPNLRHIMILIGEGTSRQPYLFIDKLQVESFCNVKEVDIIDTANIVEFQDWVSCCKNLESIHLNIPKNDFIPFEISGVNKIRQIAIGESNINKIPDFILQSTHLEQLSLRHDKIKEMPMELFKLQQLKNLSFEYAANITQVPDGIKQLPNLEWFNLWSANLEYISPELFKLPKLRNVNFAYSRYMPSEETREALQNWLSRKEKPSFTGWHEPDM